MDLKIVNILNNCKLGENMRAFRKIILMTVSIGLSACNAKNAEYTPPDIKVDQKYEDILKSLKAGGQPGEITLNGAAVKSDGTPANRISIEQSVGASAVKTEISKTSFPKLNADLKRKDDYKPSRFETYLNVGCDLKDDSRIDGMTESKNKPNEFGITDTFGAVASMVDKIFVCGKIEVTETVAVLNANEVVMNNAELHMTMPIGSISITSDVLSIEGNNSIFTKGVSDSTASLLSAPSIKLSIFENLIGNGELKLKSAGGDYVEKDAKKN